MTDQTPTLADVRERYIQPQSQGEAMAPDAHWIVGEEFDRAIEKVRAEAQAEAARESEAHVTELIERNRGLANQIVGLTDRVNESIGTIVRDAKAEALREAVDDLTDVVEGIQSSGSPNSLAWQTGALAMRDRLKSRADKLVTE